MPPWRSRCATVAEVSGDRFKGGLAFLLGHPFTEIGPNHVEDDPVVAVCLPWSGNRTNRAGTGSGRLVSALRRFQLLTGRV